MKKSLFFAMLMIYGFVSNAQSKSPIGIWKTIDDVSGKSKSHVEIYEENGKLKGKVVKLLEGATSSICKDCPGDKKNKPLIGMVVMEGLKKDGEKYSGGTILDPNKGKEYQCNIWLEKDNVLTVRGFIGFSLIGRSQTWHRIR